MVEIVCKHLKRVQEMPLISHTLSTLDYQSFKVRIREISIAFQPNIMLFSGDEAYYLGLSDIKYVEYLRRKS